MRIVIAVGGNALLERGQKPDAAVQQANAARAVRALAPLAEEHEIVVTHGNGPQVGLLALESAADPAFAAPTKFVGPVYDEETAHRPAVPVIRNEAGKLQGVEAVVDKDLATE